MASYGLNDAARAILERIGTNARYSPFIPLTPGLRSAASAPANGATALDAASLILLVVVLLLALLVALGY
jgi:hypothetical protein